MGSVLLEWDEQNPKRRAIFSPEVLKAALAPEALKKLEERAKEQQKLLDAA